MSKQKNLEHFEMRFDKGAWDAHNQGKNIQGRKSYNKRIADIQKDIEYLDRYDDFRTLKIDEDVYEKKSGSPYGIPRDNSIHIYGGQHVVLDHQVEAAHKFLSELRGFGLLADVVGSGKTYEAGIVLSELAVRNRIKTMLIVVPTQVFDTWVDVVENKFGLGKGALYQVRAQKEGDTSVDARNEQNYNYTLNQVGYTQENTPAGTVIRPSRPIIVDVKVFAQWEIRNSVVFDVIVVDEAHHLCKEDGEYAKAMQLLSTLMDVKKRSGAATYCLLLSATPHSGNLENMFRLWYFIRCKGGNPSDFEEKQDTSRSEKYLEEKKYYKEFMCRGATNVTDFIRKVKLMEVSGKYRRELNEWLRKNHQGVNFDALTEYGQSSHVDSFLEENYEIQADVLDSAAHAYHALLRSIMIRQPNKLSNSRKKIINNVLFYPVPQKVYSEISQLQTEGLQKDKITIDYTSAGLNSNFLPTVVNSSNERVSIAEYVKAQKGNWGEKDAYCNLINKALAECDKKYSAHSSDLYTKKGYVKFYVNRLRAVFENNAWQQTAILPVVSDGGKLGYKYDYLTQLFHKHSAERVIVFFDYELNKKDSVIEDVVSALQSDPAFKHRLILSDEASEETVINRFNDKQDAILLVKSAALTEGANLQSCNIIVNYQVTPDPLAMDQRIGRVFRLGQKHDVTIYSFANVNCLEGFALAYFISIGLMSSNSGDATILAGSNSDQMVTIRCKTCGNVKLMSRQEYEDCKRSNSDELICHHYNTQYEVGYDACEMEEINVNEFKCDKCGSVLARSVDDEGYECLSSNNLGQSGKMCISGSSSDRKVFCSKVCAMSHCMRLTENVDCPALKRYKEGQPESMLNVACRNCSKCSGVFEKCRIYRDVQGCRNCQYADCSPKPYVLHFNEKWEAECPRCRDRHQKGTLRPVIPKTFATYVRGLWDFQLDKKGESFCKNLDAEARKVEQVKLVLTRDDEEI